MLKIKYIKNQEPIIFTAVKQNEKIINSGDTHLMHENDAWERTLEYLLMENSFLKMRLSEGIDAVDDNSSLDQAEQFHTVFLKNDEVFKRMLAQVKFQKMLLNKKKLSSNESNDINFVKKQDAIRTEMEKNEKEFQQIKKEFNLFISHA